MPFAPHTRMTMIGTLGGLEGSPEQFSVSLNLNSLNLLSAGQDDFLFDDVVTDVKAFWSRPGSKINGAARLTSVKFASIGADGKYTKDAVLKEFTAVNGGASGALHPFQVALAVSLDTDRRGPTGKGRIYLPLPTMDVAPTGLVAAADAQSVATSVAQFFNDINNRPGLDTPAGTVSVSSSKGYLTAVTSVRVGRVLDTIRSRRTSLVEGYGVSLAVS